MSLIFQDNQGVISNIIDRSIEEIICIDGIDNNNTFNNIFLIWLKLKDKDKEFWCRIFLDAGLCFCSLYNSFEFEKIYTEDIENCEKCPVYNLHDRFSLRGLTIMSANAYRLNIDGVKLEIVLNNCDRLILWCNKLDSETNLLKSQI